MEMGNGGYPLSPIMRSFSLERSLLFHIFRYDPKGTEKGVSFHLASYKGVILMAENLRKRKITCINWYFMCKDSGEDVNHLLLHCE